MKDVLDKIFKELDQRIKRENIERRGSGTIPIPRAQVTLLGQASLLAQPELTAHLNLAQTGDLDAKLRCQNYVKQELKEILPEYHLIYDEDSHLIFIPKDSKFNGFADYENLTVRAIDPESALVSKAVKAPRKNKPLVRAALASEKYPGLAERIIAEGGKLEDFV